MEIQDIPARQALIRLFAKRREYIMLRLAATYPEKKERLQRLKPMAFEHSALEPIVKELREVEF